MDGAGVGVSTTAMSPGNGEAIWILHLTELLTRILRRQSHFLWRKQYRYENGFDITCTVPSSYLIHVNTAVELASELKAVGINMEIKQVDWATWLDVVYKGRDYETTVIALTSPYAPYDVLGKHATFIS